MVHNSSSAHSTNITVDNHGSKRSRYSRVFAAAMAGLLFTTTAYAGSDFIYVWSGDVDKKQGDRDFLATVNVNPESSDYGQVVSTTPVAEVGTMPHHIEGTVAKNNTLFASGFMANKIYLFEMEDKGNPTLLKTIDKVPGYFMSHSFIRDPETNKMIATMQYEAGNKANSGGVAVLNPDGTIDKTVSSGDKAFDKPIRSYGVEILPNVDRVITTSTPMKMEEASSDVVQIYRLSDMGLLHTLALPVPEKDPSRAHHPFEIRILDDGNTAILNTFQCGFYKVSEIGSDNPSVELVYAMDKPNQRACSVPSIAGDYWIMPVQKSNEVVVLDISDTSNVKEAFVFKMNEGYSPHYSAVEAGTNRVALTGFMGKDMRVLMLEIDPKTGALTIDDSFRDENTGGVGVDFKRASWPHGKTGPAMPHGIVWSKQ